MLPDESNVSAVPPMPVADNISFVPVASSSIKNGPLLVTLYAPGVTGNPAPSVVPLTTTCPDAFTATATAKLSTDAPSIVEYTRSPFGSSLDTKDRGLGATGAVPRFAPPICGKSGELVTPATYALPAASTAIALMLSLIDPPRNRV